MNYAIIAAGEGSRLVQEGVRVAKPLVKLDGVPMIGRLIDIFMQCNPTALSVIVNPAMPEVKAYLESLDLPVPLHIVEKATPSSMHSFYEVSRCFGGGKFCLTTVDTIFRADEFRRYIQAFEADDSVDGYMAVTSFIDDEKPLYISVDEDMLISRFEDTPHGDVKYISGGIYGLSDNALTVLEKAMADGVHRMRNYQRALIAAGLHLKAYPFDKIIDVDHASDIANAQRFIS